MIPDPSGVCERRGKREALVERHTPESMYELLQHDRYTPEEVSRLLGIGLDVVRHAAFTSQLPAEIVGEDIVSIRREDVVRWVMEQTADGTERR